MISNNDDSLDSEGPIVSLATWLSGKPFWEQYVWKVSLEKDELTVDDLSRCYLYLCEHLGLISSPPEPSPPISFVESQTGTHEEVVPVGAAKLKLVEVRDFGDVNALPASCVVKIGPHLTLVYGGNGSGKSGISRLLSNACFSRGDRPILPNARAPIPARPEPRATFVLEDEGGVLREVSYSRGDVLEPLKRFAVFDTKSVLIHLDESNKVSFTPSYIKIFDKVAASLASLERMLGHEKRERHRDNPYSLLFAESAESSVEVFCRNITGKTTENDFLRHTSSDPEADLVTMNELEQRIEERRRLDVPKRRAQLASDRAGLLALRSLIMEVLGRFGEIAMLEANATVRDVLDKRQVVKGLSISTFNDDRVRTVGSSQWKALIDAAKVIYEAERDVAGGEDPKLCPLCHQELSPEATSLFRQYWSFLEDRAEGERAEVERRHLALMQRIQSTKMLFPKFLPTDAGIGVLQAEAPHLLDHLKSQLAKLEGVRSGWEVKLGNLQLVDLGDLPQISLDALDKLVGVKRAEEDALVDPAAEIARMQTERTLLEHRRRAAAGKKDALEYIAALNWISKADSVSFSGLKMALTKKRTESFLLGVLSNYLSIFKQETAKLDCDLDLVMRASGDQGNTVKEYRLEFAEDYNPSQILSEGEQNVCALADFLTEVQLDARNCGIVFDDPVTSLDHERKDKIAKRLAEEAQRRQVLIFTHDTVFMSQLVKHANKDGVPVVAHWMRKVDGVPGHIEENASPRLANVASWKKDALEAVRDLSSLGPKEQEQALGIAFDCLRSACEALIEETLFAGTIRRHEDHVRVTNLEEVVFDQQLALQIVELHGKLSECMLGHNRSDHERQNPPGPEKWDELRKEFESLESSLKASRSKARKDREARKDAKAAVDAGW